MYFFSTDHYVCFYYMYALCICKKLKTIITIWPTKKKHRYCTIKPFFFFCFRLKILWVHVNFQIWLVTKSTLTECVFFFHSLNSPKLTCPCRICCLLFSKSYKTPTWAQAYIISLRFSSVRFSTCIFLFNPNDHITFWNKEISVWNTSNFFLSNCGKL